MRSRHLFGVCMALACWVVIAPGSLASPAPGSCEEEFVGPFPSWVNVKTAYGAVGDGKADDTAALQKACDAMRGSGSGSGPHVLFLPAGTYRLTARLTALGKGGVSIIGEHPETTRLLWDGPKDGVMMWFNGGRSRFSRLTWDGAGKAKSALEIKWHDAKDPRQTSCSTFDVMDSVFQDLGMGLDIGGDVGGNDDQGYIARCKFLRCSDFGFGLRHFNSVNWWVWHSEFIDCKVGVSNEPKPYGGVFHVYESVFRRSTEADITIFFTGFFAFRNNTSIGSRRFFHAKDCGANGAKLSIQGNAIIDPLADDPILLQTMGPMTIMDNVIRSRADQVKGPVLSVPLPHPVSVCAVGNTFTVPNPIAVSGKFYELDTKVVERKAIPDPALALPGFAPNLGRKVFDIAFSTNVTAATIQAVIDEAVKAARADAKARPVVHLSPGVYALDRPLVVPANAAIQLVGDGWEATSLRPATTDPATPALRLEGPSRATIGYLGVHGGTDGIRVDNCDQRDARVYLRACRIYGKQVGLLADGLDWARIEARGHEGDGGAPGEAANCDVPPHPFPSVKVIGGPLTAAGKGVSAAYLFGANTGRFGVENGGRLLVRDSWYEGGYDRFAILRGQGSMTLDCTMSGASGPLFVLDGFKGELSLINNLGYRLGKRWPVLDLRGDNTGARILVQCQDGSGEGDYLGFTTEPASMRGARIIALCNMHWPKYMDDIGPKDADLVRAMLAMTRQARPQAIGDLPDGVTDVRLIRVMTAGGTVGVRLAPGE